MPLTMQSFNFAIKCDENELEMYDVKQDGPNSTTAFMASEAASVNWQNNFRVSGSFRWFLSFRKPKPENGYYVYSY